MDPAWLRRYRQIGIEWPADLELIPSERASAPRLSELEAELPFAYEGA